MRIVVSNPDSIGDFVIRQPFYQALAAAGHELFLIVRSNVMPLASLVAPGATVTELASDPYNPAFDFESHDVQDIVASARQFVPDIFCIAPYQRTAFDEYLARALQPCRTVGMAGTLYRGNIDAGLDCRTMLKLDRDVAVPVDAHELLKNQRLCGVLLGRNVELADPRIVAQSHQRQMAEERLQQLGIQPGSYWIGWVGHNQYTAVRNWPLENWAQALKHAVTRFGRRFLLLGNEDERAATDEIRESMGSAGAECENLCGACESLDPVIGLIHHSAGYLGRDTGPMHLAAALGKPVLAIFGGGTWPRFTPAAKNGVVLTVPLPCAGCDWRCHLPESYCVKRVTTSAVLKAIDALEAGEVEGLAIQQLVPDSSLLARVAREGAASAREFWRTKARQEKEIAVEIQSLRDELGTQRVAETERYADLSSALGTLRADMEKATNEASAAREKEIAVEIQSLRDELSAQRAAEAVRHAELTSALAMLQVNVEKAAAERQESLMLVTAVQQELEMAKRSAASAQEAFTDCQAENAKNSAMAEDLQCRLDAADTARAEAVKAAERIKLEMDSMMMIQVNLESQLEVSESERAAGRAVLERQEVQLREAAQEINRKTDEYRKLFELMQGMTGEIENLSRQLLGSRQAQDQLERKCVALQRTIENSLALKLARSLRWALEPALKLLRKSGVFTPPAT